MCESDVGAIAKMRSFCWPNWRPVVPQSSSAYGEAEPVQERDVAEVAAAEALHEVDLEDAGRRRAEDDLRALDGEVEARLANVERRASCCR